MYTYQQVYLDDDECSALERCGRINLVGRDTHGNEHTVGRYLVSMAGQRHCSRHHFQNGLMLLWGAREELLDTAEPGYWARFGGPVQEQADLFAEERRRILVEVDAAIAIMLSGLAQTTEPDYDEEDVRGAGARAARESTFDAFLRRVSEQIDGQAGPDR